jgi:hypothetical protein
MPEPNGAQPRPRRSVRDHRPARDDQNVRIARLDRLVRKRGESRLQVAHDVADVRDGEEVVDVRAASRGVKRRDPHADERQRPRRGQRTRRAPHRIEPAPDRCEEPGRFAPVARGATQAGDRREIIGQRFQLESLRRNAQAAQIAQRRRLVSDADDEIGVERRHRFAADRAHRTDPGKAQRGRRPVRERVDADDRGSGTDREQIFGQGRRERHDPHRDGGRRREQGERDHRVASSSSIVRPGAG